jgi:signal transduction histidine kinase
VGIFSGIDMPFADFILRNMEPILAEWDDFAKTLIPSAEGRTPLALRDHAKEILEALAKDLATSESREADSEKSNQPTPQLADAPETAAQMHAALRGRSGFNINQLVAEYHALRASVLRRWVQDGEPEVAELIRFDAAIDRAIAEGVAHFAAQEERARNLLLGMLGHDMRSPLDSMVMTASHLAALNAGREVSAAAQRLIRGGASIKALLDDLVDFDRTKLGLGVKVKRSDVDLAAELAEEVEQLRGAYPDRQIELVVTGDNHGRWDGGRLRQVLRNLVCNAHQYGSPGAPIRVALRGEEADVWLEVINRGPSIDPIALSQIFDPLRRAYTEGNRPGALVSLGLGLGLFIVRQIAGAHGGEATVRCADGETAFAVRLPRFLAEASGDRPAPSLTNQRPRDV